MADLVLLLDFFGTLVDYDPSRTAQGYERSHACVRALGVDLGYPEFLARWVDVSEALDAASDEDDHEYSMHEVAAAFLGGLSDDPSGDAIEDLIETYLAEWSTGIRPIAGVTELLDELGRDHRLAVVTNTHHPSLVPGQLQALGLDRHIELVVTSVEVGWRKPHATIFETALTRLGVSPGDALFVGDTKVPDYDGPRAHGMRALLVDPDGRHDIPEEDRLQSVLDLPAALDALHR